MEMFRRAPITADTRRHWDARASRASAARTNETLTIRPPRTVVVGTLVASIVTALIVLGSIAAFLVYQGWVFFGDEQFERLFHLDRELSVPATVSVLGLASCSLLLALLTAARHQGGHGYVRHWAVLAIGFALMAVDEGAAVHETGDAALNGLAITSEYAFLSRAWVLAGGAIALVVGLAYIPFLLHLPRWYAIGFAAAGAMYLAGALGFEMIGAQAVADEAGAFYMVTVVLEEGLELSGLGLFLVLLWSLATQTPWRIDSPALEESRESSTGV